MPKTSASPAKSPIHRSPGPKLRADGADGLAELSPRETASVVGRILAPLLARGFILRRQRVENLFDRFDADRAGVRLLQRLRDRYDARPVRLRLPGREAVIVLAPEDVRRVLEGSPEPFAPANREKKAALSHFQPHGVLISEGTARDERRRFNETVLDSGRSEHRLAERFLTAVGEEAETLLRLSQLDWEAFATSWWRVVRRIVLGDAARGDQTASDLLERLRGDANWAQFRPRRDRLRRRFVDELERHLDRAEEGSLARVVASQQASPETRPADQMAHWLFAFDAAGMATFRALALLAAHRGRPAEDPAVFRAAVLESLRLWPTTPAIVRDATMPVRLGEATVPAGAAVLIYTPFFHRDRSRLACADRFCPELWLESTTADDWPLVPFSGGPAECPGRNLVLLVTSAMLARLAGAFTKPVPSGAVAAGQPLPATLSPFRLRFRQA